MGSCAAPSAKGDDKFITTDYLQQCRFFGVAVRIAATGLRATGVGARMATGCVLPLRVACAPETSLKLSTSWASFPAWLCISSAAAAACST
ncbi:TPA: hypothetical protein ACJCWQ_004316, partial [Yersinia enterocolitica]